MNNMITDLVLQKRNSIPKKKINITEENLVIDKKNIVKKIKKSKKCLSESSDESDDSDIEV